MLCSGASYLDTLGVVNCCQPDMPANFWAGTNDILHFAMVVRAVEVDINIGLSIVMVECNALGKEAVK